MARYGVSRKASINIGALRQLVLPCQRPAESFVPKFLVNAALTSVAADRDHAVVGSLASWCQISSRRRRIAIALIST